ncbi:ExeM/NucH family extracellular endonuclease [Marinobacter confluentis]|uniref:ExeM/NucH family extracellular endonuclease n=1 Tax=Marinobacter confluentis TaxID=1697557 RepID=UPI001CD95351|nr:ExeM/NucH family extracellular endonuclease [Marinobacter confluentis]
MPHGLLTWVLASLLVTLSGTAFARCGADALQPSDVQGTGQSSPLVGQTVTVEGVITQDSRHPGGWRGFYLQQTDARTDHNPQTSDALFIYTDRPGGAVGSQVRVTGQVKEYHGLTELTRVSDLTVCGAGKLPVATPVQLPWPDQQPPEHLENMRVTLAEPLTLIGHYSFARYGELILAHSSQTVPTELLAPGPEAAAMGRKQLLNRLYLDDGQSIRNPRPLPWPAPRLANGVPFRAGDALGALTGILDFRFGHWRLQPDQSPEIILRNPRPDPPPRSDNTTLRIVTLNLGNYFNGDGSGAGFEASRGARSSAQLATQTSRLRAGLHALEPDVIAAVELENDDYSDTSAIADLAAALGPEWQFVATPGITGTDAIRTDLFYRADRVRPLGEPQRLTDGRYGYRGRPPVAQVFQPIAGSNPATVRIIVPHLKSKACGGAEGADKDQNDGQGCYARRRTDNARALAIWLESLPEPENGTNAFAGNLITGDLNSYAREWPIQQLENAGLINLVRAHQACTPDNCPETTYRYQGRQGSLDYAMGSEALLKHLVSAGAWAINAAEFPAIGYQGPIQLPAGVPWRSSDHNPLYIDLAL